MDGAKSWDTTRRSATVSGDLQIVGVPRYRLAPARVRVGFRTGTPPKRPSLEKRLGRSDLVIGKILLLCHRFSSYTIFIMALNLNVRRVS